MRIVGSRVGLIWQTLFLGVFCLRTQTEQANPWVKRLFYNMGNRDRVIISRNGIFLNLPRLCEHAPDLSEFFFFVGRWVQSWPEWGSCSMFTQSPMCSFCSTTFLYLRGSLIFQLLGDELVKVFSTGSRELKIFSLRKYCINNPKSRTHCSTVGGVGGPS